MKKRLLLLFIPFIFALPVHAQDSQSSNFRRYDIGLNFLSYARQFDEDTYGGNLSFVVRKSERWGIVADVDIHSSGFSSDVETTTYRFGPRFYARERGRITPFAEVLAGGAHVAAVQRTTLLNGAVATVTTVKGNGFAFAAGGGLDMRIRPWFAWRMIQVDYSLLDAAGDTSNGVRAGMGIVFRFGH